MRVRGAFWTRAPRQATADFMQSAKPYTDALRAAGPEGVVAGAARPRRGSG